MKLLKFSTAAVALMMSLSAFAGSEFDGLQSKQSIIDRISAKNPIKHMFVKDAPVFAYRITSGHAENIPAPIFKNLGSVDQTKYTSAYISQNIGSVFALQMNGDKPDFYLIGKPTFESKYTVVSAADVATKNAKYFAKLKAVIPELLSSNDANLVAVIKLTPVPMVQMSEAGFPVDTKITIESPWGEQTKPAGQDAFLVFDESKQQYYMVNTDKNGLPLSYVPAK